MTWRSERSFHLTVLALSCVAAFCFVSNFTSTYLLDVVLAAATMAGVALGGRWLWLSLSREYRSFPVFFGLLLAFWVVVWFWAIDDFLPRHVAVVLLNALSCAILCMPLHWSPALAPARRPYLIGHMLALTASCLVFWFLQDAIAQSDANLFLAFVPLVTLEGSLGLALAWLILLRKPVRAIVRNWAAAARGELVGLAGFRWCTARMARRTGWSLRSCASRLALIPLALTVVIWSVVSAVSAALPSWETRDWLGYLVLMGIGCTLLMLLSALNLILAWPAGRSTLPEGAYSPSTNTARPSAAAATSLRESLGFLFEIDEPLITDPRDRRFGRSARRIVMQHFTPHQVPGAFVWAGATLATLAGRESRWCVAITPKNSDGLRAFRDMLSKVEDGGPSPPPERFVRHPIDLEIAGSRIIRTIGNESSLGLWFSVEEKGGSISLADPADEDVALCKEFGHPFRLPGKLARQLAGIHDRSQTPQPIARNPRTAEVSALFAAVELEREGVPGTLMRFAKYFRYNDKETYQRYCVAQLIPILDWSGTKVAARSDAAEVCEARDYLSSLGYWAVPKVVN